MAQLLDSLAVFLGNLSQMLQGFAVVSLMLIHQFNFCIQIFFFDTIPLMIANIFLLREPMEKFSNHQSPFLEFSSRQAPEKSFAINSQTLRHPLGLS